MDLKGKIIEAQGKRSFKNAEGETVEYQNALVRVDDTVLRFKAGKDVELENYVDKDVVLTLEFRPDAKMYATPKIVGVLED